MNKTTRLKKPQIPELETLYTFDELGGRPKYGGVEMTSETDIPSFQEIMDETHSAVVAEATARDDADEELQAQIDAEVAARTAAESQLSDDLTAETSARQAADTALQTNITAEASARESADTALAGDLATETSARATKDADLQSQVDAIVASSDVKDIVGSKAELDNYDTSTLGDQDIIKVLQDESQSNATTYYRWNASTSAFSLIGSEGPYYTKTQADTLLGTKADKATTYTKTEVNNALDLKADKATTYTKTEVDTALGAKQNTLTAGNNITIANDVISAEGGVKKLTTDDYNYTMGSTRGIALWLLEPNVYITDGQLITFPNRHTSSGLDSGTAFIVNPYGNAHVTIAQFGFPEPFVIVYRTKKSDGTDDGVYQVVNNLTTNNSAKPLSAAQGKALKDMIGDLANLTTTTKTNLVAAINEIVASSSGVTIFYTSSGLGGRGTDIEGPVFFKDVTYQTPATWAEIYAAFINGKVLICSNMSDDLFYSEVVSAYSQYENYSITLSAYEGMTGNDCLISGYNDGTSDWYSFYYSQVPTIVQTPGTSQTDVMSQNATTGMVYQNPSLKIGVKLGSGANVGTSTSAAQSIAIGKNATATGTNAIAIGNYVGGAGTSAQATGMSSVVLGSATASQHSAVAIGNTSSASGLASVALGAGARATQQGQLDVSAGVNSTSGYNNSAYRLLTGLYDPQSDHDAATKGYVDTAVASVGAEEINSTDWSNLWQ